jgi:uncharacterized protein YcbK (DUF882 family)
MLRAGLKTGAALMAGAPFINVLGNTSFLSGDPSQNSNANMSFWSQPRWVWLRRPSTGEEIKRVYWADGQMISQAYHDISWFMRDARFERMLQTRDLKIFKALSDGYISREQLTPWALMDPILLDILYAHCGWLQYHNLSAPLLITSGFRHILTNADTEGAAFDSWHTKAGAGDLVVPGIDPKALASYGRWLSGGGVGLYVRKNFVHVDRGRVRSWIG